MSVAVLGQWFDSILEVFSNHNNCMIFEHGKFYLGCNWKGIKTQVGPASKSKSNLSLSFFFFFLDGCLVTQIMAQTCPFPFLFNSARFPNLVQPCSCTSPCTAASDGCARVPQRWERCSSFHWYSSA